MTNEEKLYRAMNRFEELMKGLALDERDSYPNFDEVLKEEVGFIPTRKNKDIYIEYRDFKKRADKSVELASSLAMAYRKEGRVEIAKSEVAYYQALEYLC